jgi:hypothetical protein
MQAISFGNLPQMSTPTILSYRFRPIAGAWACAQRGGFAKVKQSGSDKDEGEELESHFEGEGSKVKQLLVEVWSVRAGWIIYETCSFSLWFDALVAIATTCKRPLA